MKPSLYIGIDGRQVTKCSPKVYKRRDLSLMYRYVLEAYEKSNNKFFFKIFKNDVEQNFIDVGNWKITNIRPAEESNIAFLFDLVDPSGESSKDIDLPYNHSIDGTGTHLVSKLLFNDNTGLNDMMNLATKAASFENWKDYIKNGFESILSNNESE